jgi:ketopantoate reductase
MPDLRILVLGAGGIGGYFAGQLAESSADVTFMVLDRSGSRTALAAAERGAGETDFVARKTNNARADCALSTRQNWGRPLLGHMRTVLFG